MFHSCFVLRMERSYLSLAFLFYSSYENFIRRNEMQVAEVLVVSIPVLCFSLVCSNNLKISIIENKIIGEEYIITWLFQLKICQSHIIASLVKKMIVFFLKLICLKAMLFFKSNHSLLSTVIVMANICYLTSLQEWVIL